MEKQQMIKLRGFWRSAATFRVRIALNLKGLAYQEEMKAWGRRMRESLLLPEADV